MSIRIVVIGLILYFLYQFIFRFLVPVTRAARDMKTKMNEFQSQMRQQQGFGPNAAPAETPAKQPKGGDYIEFEEVK